MRSLFRWAVQEKFWQRRRSGSTGWRTPRRPCQRACKYWGTQRHNLHICRALFIWDKGKLFKLVTGCTIYIFQP